MSLTNRILIAMVAGIAVGSIINLLVHSTGVSEGLKSLVDVYFVNGLFDVVGPHICRVSEAAGRSASDGLSDLRRFISWRQCPYGAYCSQDAGFLHGHYRHRN